MSRGMRAIRSAIRIAVRAACVLAAITICVLWWRSHGRVDAVGYRTGAGADFEVSTAMPGRLVLHWEDLHGISGVPEGFRAASSSPRSSGTIIPSGGFFITRTTKPSNLRRVMQEIFGNRREFAGFSLLTAGATSRPAGAKAVELAWLFSGLEYVRVGVPLWFLEALACLPVAWWGCRVMLRKRIKPGFCRRCGYDLRATPERCPECGLVVDRRAARPGEQGG